jgi:type II secretory pathway pseudopilin PulG
MVSSDSSQTRNIPARDKKACKAGPGARIAAAITGWLLLPLVFLEIAAAITGWLLLPLVFFGSVLGALFVLVLCALVMLSLHQLLTQPSYASVLYAGALLAIPVMILCLVLLPGFLAYPSKSRVAAAVGTTESIRAALAAYAADTPGKTYPPRIASWEELVSVVNPNGATLNGTEAEQGFDLRGYTPIDSDGDGIVEDYTMSFLVTGVPDTHTGRLILVRPSGIEKTKR